MKIAHEAPLSIFDRVQAVTDYDYALVHLFEESEEYYNTFVKAKENGREVLLDNSIFELGTAFNGGVYADWVTKLKPDWYIAPDVLDDANATIDSFDSFMLSYPDLPGKVIGVAQGSSYDELVACYRYMANDPRVDKVAMPFNHPFFQELSGDNKYYRMMMGRQQTIRKMVSDGIINEDKPHHLLGCGLPQEFVEYQNYKWIDSVDTSNPVIHGMKGIRYHYIEYLSRGIRCHWACGLNNKESVKLFTLIDEDVVACWDDIDYNIKKFKEICNGTKKRETLDCDF